MNKQVYIERYTFSLNNYVSMATATSFGMVNSPNKAIAPDLVLTNSPARGWFLIRHLKIANHIVLKDTDAFDLRVSDQGQGRSDTQVMLANVFKEFRTIISPQTSVMLEVDYSGLFGLGFTPKDNYPFTLSIQGKGIDAEVLDKP